MNKILYAIGDLHGCLKALKNILNQIDEDRNGEPAKIIFLGDYTDRGPSSAELVQYLIDLNNNPKDIEYIFIRGNHDVMLMDAAKGLESGLWMFNGGNTTLDSYHRSAVHYDLEKHVDEFFKYTKLYHQEGEFVFVHAGLDPDESLDNQRTHTLIWDRVWNNYNEKYFNDVFVIHGHTPVFEPDKHTNQLNIDTGCCFGLKYPKEFPLGLTAVRINSRTDFKFFHAKEE